MGRTDLGVWLNEHHADFLARHPFANGRPSVRSLEDRPTEQGAAGRTRVRLGHLLIRLGHRLLAQAPGIAVPAGPSEYPHSRGRSAVAIGGRDRFP